MSLKPSLFFLGKDSDMAQELRYQISKRAKTGSR